MATQLLAVGAAAANSGDLVIDAGEAVTVCLTNGAASIAWEAQVLIQLKDHAGNYIRVAELTGAVPSLMIQAPGTYRFARLPGVSCGVFSA